MRISSVSHDELEFAGRQMDKVSAIQPKKVDFQNPFYTQLRAAPRPGVGDLPKIHGESIRHVYVHVPFCTTRCTYCHYPIVQPGTEPANAHDDYVDTLLAEIDGWSRSGLDFGNLKTIAIGGGTPNALSRSNLERILTKLNECFPTREEVSIEVLPSFRILDEATLKMFKDYGVNRLSLGIQTFNDAVNDANRRTYQRALDTRTLVALAKTYFPNVSVDLLYRQKTQEWEDLVRDVEGVRELDVSSVYLYQVREHVGTKLVDLQKALNYFLAELTMDGQHHAVSFDQVIKNRNSDGFCRARSGRSQCENLLGIGPSAVSEIGEWTFRNVDPTAYTRGAGIDTSTVVSRDPLALQSEWISRGFRHFNVETIDGISFEMFESRFGERPNQVLVDKLRYMEEAGLMEVEADSATLTNLGMLFTQAISGYLIGHYK